MSCFYRIASYLLEVDWDTEKKRVNKERKYWGKKILPTEPMGFHVCAIPPILLRQTNTLVQVDSSIHYAMCEYEAGRNPNSNLECVFAMFHLMVTYFPQCTLVLFLYLACLSYGQPLCSKQDSHYIIYYG